MIFCVTTSESLQILLWFIVCIDTARITRFQLDICENKFFLKNSFKFTESLNSIYLQTPGYESLI